MTQKNGNPTWKKKNHFKQALLGVVARTVQRRGGCQGRCPEGTTGPFCTGVCNGEQKKTECRKKKKKTRRTGFSCIG